MQRRVVKHDDHASHIEKLEEIPMVQLVFVHGVATRSGSSYTQSVANRDTLFHEIAFKGRNLTIYSPLWGNHVPRIEPKVFDTDKGVDGSKGVGSFSIHAVASGQMGGLGVTAVPSTGGDVAAVARQNATVAMDAVFAQVLETADHTGQPLTAEQLVVFRKAVEAIEQDAAPARVDRAATDADLAKSLGSVGDSSFGIVRSLGDAVSAVTDRIRNTASTVAFGAVRDFISPAVGLFLGDVFAYLQEGDLRNRIQETVRKDLLRAHEASKAGGGPVVVIGHSMGGVILADMLQDLSAAGLPADLKVAALFTVGSQPGLFRSVGLLAGAVGSDGRTPRPPCVAAWFNVFDPIDPLAFRANPLYSDVEDLVFDSITGLASAHTTYFSRPQFYARFRKRLSTLGII